ncbi:hypothetical protein ZWY2020_009908 [Hordeum vulgare]|nr:hypothetical protein ZWY2020_009908 [Hordeum vulgare]
MVRRRHSPIADAARGGEKLPFALILCGVLEAAAALWLVLYRKPAGVLADHGKAVFCSYYVVLAAVVLYGLAEAFVGLSVSCHPCNRRRLAVGKVFLWLSIFPLVLVAGLGGMGFAVPKYS